MRRLTTATLSVASLCITLGTLGCVSKEPAAGSAPTGGTVVISTAADADALFPPFMQTTQARAINEQLFDYLADVGDAMNVVGDRGYVPHLAQRWDWAPDSLSIAFHLDPRARWHDGIPVRANDVHFSFALYRDPALATPIAPLLANIDSVSVRDSLTPVFWFKRRTPTAFFDATAQMLIIPEHVYGTVPPSSLRSSDLIRHPIGSGRFRFSQWLPASKIELVADTANYRGRAKLDRVIWSIAPDITTAATRLLAGEADVLEAMRPDNVKQAASVPALRVATEPGMSYGFLLFNLRDPHAHAKPHPLFGDAAVRRALTMAVDRKSIVQSVFDSLAAPSIGPGLRAMPTTDTTITQIPFDPTGAARLLDSLGWRPGKDGIREKNGTKLAFTLYTPGSSMVRGRCAVLMQEQLKQIGVQVSIQQLDINAFVHAESTHQFDAAMHVWTVDATPGGALDQLWSAKATNDATGLNYGSYANPAFDVQVDSALFAPTLDAARPHYKRALQTIVNDAPGIWVYEPRTVIGIAKRIHVPSMRPDAWWAHLADWSIPSDQRIARDQIGLR